MAKVIEQLAPAQSCKAAKPKPQKTIWDTVLDGRAWEMKQGKDFSCKAVSAIVSAHQQAKKRGLKVKTRFINEKTIQVQATIPPAPAVTEIQP